jgi:phage tail-like protein
MRGTVEGLISPHPLGDTLPGLYRDDRFTQDLCAGLDETLAPVLLALDNIPAYLDLATTPADMLPWLARWVGMAVDPGQQPERQRELLRTASELHGWHGTARGIQLAVEVLFGMPTEVIESGAAAWSMDPTARLPGEPVPAVVVQVSPTASQEVDLERLNAVVVAVKPAHVVHRVQVVGPQS